jgi:Fe-S-cluster containining protein
VVELRAGDMVPGHFIVEHAGARCMDQRSDGACVALNPVTKLCTIYSNRPQTCRDFNRGESLCLRILAAARNLTTILPVHPDSAAAPAT